MAGLGLCCYEWAYSSCGEWKPLFHMMHGLLIAVVSCCRAQTLGAQASGVVAHRLNCPEVYGISSQTRYRTHNPRIGRRILNLGTTRGVLSIPILNHQC